MSSSSLRSMSTLKNRSKVLKIYTYEDVSKHARPRDCWVTHNEKVYDVSKFLTDHPGGDDLVLQYAGKDVGDIMEDADSHDHSDAAYDILREYQIGVIGSEETTCHEDNEVDEHFQPTATNLARDYEKNHFLDLERPLIMQVWRANFSKSFYLQQVHQPRHLPEPCRLFGPWYLEMFTRTPWYVVPTVWLPIAGYLFWLSMKQQLPVAGVEGVANGGPFQMPVSALGKTFVCFLFGNFVWTILEYVFHRFLFHVDNVLPDHPAALTLHFLMHGIHHYLPMDGLRLVMPPLLFFVLSYPMTRLAYALFPLAYANGIISGAFVFYVLYDLMHYAFHHAKMPSYIKEQKVYHMAHHFKQADLGFGVTSSFWDKVFGTELKLAPPKSKRIDTALPVRVQ